MTLLTASSLLPVSEADTLTAVSSEVMFPWQQWSRPMMIDGTCSLFAALELPFYEKVRTFDQQDKPMTRQTSTEQTGRC